MLEVNIPAMRGKMGSREYYACLMPMSAVPQFFKFTDWDGFSPEDREQRVLSEKRVPDLAQYIEKNEDDYLFASVTASYKTQPRFIPYSDVSPNNGTLVLELGDELIINDGQHRCAGIAQALKNGAPIGRDTISILLFPYENKDRVQQMFSDLNRYVQKTSKSLDILFDKRDDMAAVTLSVIEQVPAFKELTDKENQALGAKSTKLFTLAALYDANVELTGKKDERTIAEKAAFLTEYWNEVARYMTDWGKVVKGQKLAQELRQQNISSHSTVLRALGGLGADIHQLPDWKAKLAMLQTVDWSKKNPEWENICIVSNSVVSNRQARVATKAFIKSKLGLVLTDGEHNALKQKTAA